MVAETRSQRQQAYTQQRPPYPQITTAHYSAQQQQQHQQPHSASHSVFQSSTSSLSSISSASGHPTPNTMLSPHQQQQNPFGNSSSAPLPSPSAGHQHEMQMSYFASLSAQSQTGQAPTSHPGQQQWQQQQHQNAAYLGQRGNDGGRPETAPFLQDFSLLNEAAKRAQMACLSRDLGEIGL